MEEFLKENALLHLHPKMIVDPELIQKKRQETIEMCRIFTETKQNLNPKTLYKVTNYENKPVIPRNRTKRDTSDPALGGLNKEDAKRVEGIVDKLYDEVTENGEPVPYRQRQFNDSTAVKQKLKIKSGRRFNFAPAKLLGPDDSDDEGKKELKQPSDTGYPFTPWPKKWKQGIIPFFIDPKSYDDQLSELIQKAFDYFEKATCMRLQRLRERPTDSKSLQGVEWLYITNPSGIRQCVHSNEKLENKGVQMVVFGYDCMMQGEILHEIMHVLGFSHEHTRPDRDEHVTVLWDNIKPGYKKYFEARSEDLLMNLPYDHSSVLHYPPRAFSKNGKPTIMTEPGVKVGQRNGLSETDVEKVGIVFGYECVKRDRQYLLQTCPTVVKSKYESKPDIPFADIEDYFENRVWPFGIVNYQISSSVEFSIEERENIQAVIRHIEKETCIEFRNLGVSKGNTETDGSSKEHNSAPLEKKATTSNEFDDLHQMTSSSPNIIPVDPNQLGQQSQEESPDSQISEDDKPENVIGGGVIGGSVIGGGVIGEEKMFSTEMFSKEKQTKPALESQTDVKVDNSKPDPLTLETDDSNVSKITAEGQDQSGQQFEKKRSDTDISSGEKSENVIEDGVIGDGVLSEKMFSKEMFSGDKQPKSASESQSQTEDLNSDPNLMSDQRDDSNVSEVSAEDQDQFGQTSEKELLDAHPLKGDKIENVIGDGVLGDKPELAAETDPQEPSDTSLLKDSKPENQIEDGILPEKMFSKEMFSKEKSKNVILDTRPLAGRSPENGTLDNLIRDGALGGEMLNQTDAVPTPVEEIVVPAQVASTADLKAESISESYPAIELQKKETDNLNQEGVIGKPLFSQEMFTNVSKKLLRANSEDNIKLHVNDSLKSRRSYQENIPNVANFGSLVNTKEGGEKPLKFINSPLRTLHDTETSQSISTTKTITTTIQNSSYTDLTSSSQSLTSILFSQNASTDVTKGLQEELKNNNTNANQDTTLPSTKQTTTVQNENSSKHINENKSLDDNIIAVDTSVPNVLVKRVRRSVPLTKVSKPQTRRHAAHTLTLVRSSKPGCQCPNSGRPDGSQVVEIGTDCFNSVNDLLHLFVHLLGLDHQHNMHDRDDYLKIFWDKLSPEVSEDMKKKLEPAASVGFSYDYQSVMHYPWLHIKNGVTQIMYPIWNDGWAMGHWQGLSTTDVHKLNTIYEKQCKKRKSAVESSFKN